MSTGKNLQDEASLFLGLWYYLQGQTLADGAVSGKYVQKWDSNKK